MFWFDTFQMNFFDLLFQNGIFHFKSDLNQKETKFNKRTKHLENEVYVSFGLNSLFRITP